MLVPPSPKLQLQVVIVPGVTLELSVKVVASPIHTVVAVKAGVGIGFTVTVWVVVSKQPPPDVTMSVTV